MEYDEESLHKKVEKHYMEMMQPFAMEFLAIVGLVIYILGIVGIEVFLAFIIITNVIQLVLIKNFLEGVKDTVSKANELQVSLKSYENIPGLNGPEERNDRFQKFMRIISITTLASPWVFLIFGILAMM